MVPPNAPIPNGCLLLWISEVNALQVLLKSYIGITPDVPNLLSKHNLDIPELGELGKQNQRPRLQDHG